MLFRPSSLIIRHHFKKSFIPTHKPLTDRYFSVSISDFVNFSKSGWSNPPVDWKDLKTHHGLELTLDFVSEKEESSLIEETTNATKRLKYQKGHWDQGNDFETIYF